jgi:ubiquitin C-terminal hydrolase
LVFFFDVQLIVFQVHKEIIDGEVTYDDSSYLLDFVNRFGDEGGFELISEKVRDKKTPLKMITNYLNVLKAANKVFPPDFETPYLRTITGTLVDRLQKMGEEDMKGFDQKILTTLTADVEALMKYIASPEEASSVSQRINLDSAHRSIMGSTLQQKLQGMTSLIALVETLERRSDKNGALSKTFVDWLNERSLIDMLIGSDAHHEVIKKSPKIFKYLSSIDALSHETVQRLWLCLHDKHEVVQRVIYSTIAEIASSLTEKDLDFIFAELRKMDPHTFADWQLEFLKNFTRNAIRATSGKEKYYGVEIFWELIQDSSNIEQHVFQIAFDSLVAQLKSFECENLKYEFVMRTMSALNEGCVGLQYFDLAKALLADFPESSLVAGKSVEKVITEADKVVPILPTTLSNFSKYFALCRKSPRVPAEEKSAQPISLNDSILNGRFDHFANIQRRLEFIEFVTRKSSILLKISDLDTLWQFLVLNGIAVADGDILCRWLVKNRETKERGMNPVYDESVGKHLFEDLLTEIPPISFSADRYICFETFFKQVNSGYKGGLQHPFFDNYLEVSNMDLIGIKSLWDICTLCPLQSVIDKSVPFLLKIHLKLERVLKPYRKDIWKEFLNTCVKRLTAIPNSADSPDRKKQIALQILDCVTKFIQACENEAKPADGRSYVSPEDQADAQYPRHALSSETFIFNSLFESLAIGGAYSQHLWKLLWTLPVNDGVWKLVSFVGTAEVNVPHPYDKLFDTSSLIKLLYNVEVIRRYLFETQAKDIEEQKAEGQVKQTWSFNFVLSGGVLALSDALTTVNSESWFEDMLPQRCLDIILKLLNHFLANFEKELPAPLDYAKLSDYTIQLIHHASLKKCSKAIANKDDPQATVGEASEILVASGELLTECLKRVPESISKLADPKLTGPIFKQALLRNPDEGVRRAIAHTFFVVAQRVDRFLKEDSFVVLNLKNPKAVYLPLLLELLSQVDTRNDHCESFFDLLSSLLQEVGKDEEVPFDVSGTVFSLIQKIKSQPITEQSADQPDHVLAGILNVTSRLINIIPSIKEEIGVGPKHQLLQEVFFKCLFELPGPEHKGGLLPPKCKSKPSRESAFRLLATLVQDCETNMKELIKLLLPYHVTTHSNGNDLSEWDFKSESQQKSPVGYVGIKNLGCICYMNSLIQQLFMMTNLRKGLLGIPLKDEPKEESFMYQMQYILAYLQESEKEYCDPSGFCYAFKDWDGSPTNVTVQKDTNEFLNMLFDRIDTYVQNTEHKDVLRKELGGVFSNQMIGKGQGCVHSTDREESFYCITLNVKNCKNVQQSLDAFVAGEMLAGDNAKFCDQCNKKCDTLTRVVVKDLPPRLILHMKRFELNYETLNMQKIFDAIEFPTKLDMKPYTREGVRDKKYTPAKPEEKKGAPADGDGKDEPAEGFEVVDPSSPSVADVEEEELKTPQFEQKPDEYYQYELVGVLIHNGEANRGHYYSYIKERTDDKVSGRWLEFNDVRVTPFDEKRIPEAAFGGKEEYVPEFDEFGGYNAFGEFEGYPTGGGLGLGYGGAGAHSQPATRIRDKQNSAYLLFYERVNANDEIPESKGDKKPIFKRERSDSRVSIPMNIFSQIWEENATYWRDKFVFDPLYFDFHENMLKQYSFAESKEPSNDENSIAVSFFQLELRYTFETLCRSAYKNDRLSRWFTSLKESMAKDVSLAVYLLRQMVLETGWLHELLLDCKLPAVRECVSDLLLHAVQQVAPSEAALIGPELEHKSKNPPILLQFLQKLLGLLRVVPSLWKNMDQLLNLLAGICKIGPNIAGYMIGQRLVGRLLDIVIGNGSPLEKLNNIPVDAKGERPKMGDSVTKPNFSCILDCIASLGAFCQTNAMAKNSEVKPPTLRVEPSAALKLNADDAKALFEVSTLTKLVETVNTKAKATAATAFFKHFLHEDKDLSDLIVQVLMAGIVSSDYDDLEAFMLCVLSFLSVEDSLQKLRINDCMQRLLTTVETQSNYWKATDLAIEYICRIAFEVKDAYIFIMEHKPLAQWMSTWLIINAKAPYAHSMGNMQLVKPKTQEKKAMMLKYGEGNLDNPFGMAPSDKRDVINAILEGRDITKMMTDTDEVRAQREFSKGMLVDCEDKQKKWCECEIVDLSSTHVKVTYLGWGPQFDEWIPRSSKRLAAYQEMLSRPDVPKYGPRPHKYNT